MEIRRGTQQLAPDSILEYVLCSASVRRDFKQKYAFVKSSEIEGDETPLNFADGAFEDGDARDCSGEELFQ